MGQDGVVRAMRVRECGIESEDSRTSTLLQGTAFFKTSLGDVYMTPHCLYGLLILSIYYPGEVQC